MAGRHHANLHIDVEPYRDLIAEFIAMVAVDPRYSEEMARRAVMIKRRLEAKAARERAKNGN